MMNSRNRETIVGAAILFVLVLIAAGVFMKQFRYDPGLFKAAEPRASLSAVGSSEKPGADLGALAPQGLEPLTPPETFGAENLSDKIDGRAELYLSAGFESLTSRRFKKAQRPASWLELFIYDMGSMRNAYSVFSVQRRAGAEDVELTRFAYLSGNALFFVNGGQYVEIIAADGSMRDEMLAMAKKLIESSPPREAEAMGEQAMFPAEGLDPSTVSLHAADVFGFDRLDNTFTAEYSLSGESVTAFLSSRGSPGEASELASAYHRFLLENGGSDVEAALPIPGAGMVQVFDVFEVIFSHEDFLAGVHEAPSAETATELAVRLHEAIKKAEK